VRTLLSAVSALIGCFGCAAEAARPDVAFLPLEAVAGPLGGVSLTDSLRLAVTCRLEQRGIRVAFPSVDQVPAESLRTPEQLGSELGAAWALSGSVYAQGESLRVVLHLTQVDDDRGAWVGAFLGVIPAIDTLEEAMARAVSARLLLGGGEFTAVANGRLPCNQVGLPD